jgi:hypothetical protein
METSKQPGISSFSRNPVPWIAFVSLLTLTALAILFAPRSDSPNEEEASENPRPDKQEKPSADASVQAQSTPKANGQTWHLAKDSERLILIRKTLDLPSELNFSRVGLPHALAWLEQTIGITFLLETDGAAQALAEVSVQAKDMPLREILAEILAPNDLALALRGDTAMILPCSLKREEGLDGKPAFTEIQAALSAAPGEPVEFYAGPRNQRRIRIVARMAPKSTPEKASWQAYYCVYAGAQILSQGFLAAQGGAWNGDNSSLSLRVAEEGKDTLAVEMRFRYAHGG